MMKPAGFSGADFDKTGWQDDARAFLRVCSEWNVAAALERSRSGRSGHAWMFFAAAIPAVLVRKLGAAVLNAQIVRDVLAAVAAGRSPMVLTGRRSHADALACALRGKTTHVVVLNGGLDAKARAAARPH